MSRYFIPFTHVEIEHRNNKTYTFVEDLNIDKIISTDCIYLAEIEPFDIKHCEGSSYMLESEIVHVKGRYSLLCSRSIELLLKTTTSAKLQNRLEDVLKLELILATKDTPEEQFKLAIEHKDLFMLKILEYKCIKSKLNINVNIYAELSLNSSSEKLFCHAAKTQWLYPQFSSLLSDILNKSDDKLLDFFFRELCKLVKINHNEVFSILNKLILTDQSSDFLHEFFMLAKKYAMLEEFVDYWSNAYEFGIESNGDTFLVFLVSNNYYPYHNIDLTCIWYYIDDTLLKILQVHNINAELWYDQCNVSNMDVKELDQIKQFNVKLCVPKIKSNELAHFVSYGIEVYDPCCDESDEE